MILLQHSYNGQQEKGLKKLSKVFLLLVSFPGVIGAIDGTHINIPAPKENPESYINRKGHYSIQAKVHNFLVCIITGSKK